MADSTLTARLRVVMVGDSFVGKTSMLILWSYNKLALDYVPTTADTSVSVARYGHNVYIELVDTGGGEDYARLRPLCYPGCDIFVLLYSVVHRPSFQNISVDWIPELKHHMPNTPVILVANKIDLRHIGDHNPSHLPVTYKEGLSLAHQHRMSFTETSTFSRAGVDDLLDKIIELVFTERQRPRHVEKLRLYSAPSPPPLRNPPYISIEETTFPSDMKALVNNEEDADVIFHVGDGLKMFAHRIVLCHASNFFCGLFGITAPQDGIYKGPLTMKDINEGRVRGLSSMWEDVATETSGTLVHIRLESSENISLQSLRLILQFMYTGQLQMPSELSEDVVHGLATLADTFDLPHLSEMVSSGVECLKEANLSIQMYAGSRHWQRGELFVFNPKFADVRFSIEGTLIPAHKVLLKARSLYMAKMFNGQFAETFKDVISLPDIKLQDFVAMLKFLYSDTCSLEYSVPWQHAGTLLKLSDQWGVSRLKHIVERHLADEFGGRGVHQAYYMLQEAKACNATQLIDYMRHVICTHYDSFSEGEVWKQRFSQEDLDYFEENRHPPAVHDDDMEEFRRLGGARVGERSSGSGRTCAGKKTCAAM